MTLIAPNATGIIYSPYTWSVTSGSAKTICAGAYFKTQFTGNTCTLNFDTSLMTTPVSEIWYRIDNLPLVQANVATTIAVTIPAITLSNSDFPYHLLEVFVKSTTQNMNRWITNTSGTCVSFTGLTLDAGAVIATPQVYSRQILMFGDSITEGVRVFGETASNDTDNCDALSGWAYQTGRALNAEVGIVGFGGQGITVTGSGGVPAFPSAYSFLFSGTARSFSPTPTLIVINQGTNDGSASTTTSITTVLNGLITACPGTPIAVMEPFNGAQATNLQAAIAACSYPGVCHYIPTTGIFITSLGSDGFGIHPNASNNAANIAPQVTALMSPLVSGITKRWTH